MAERPIGRAASLSHTATFHTALRTARITLQTLRPAVRPRRATAGPRPLRRLSSAVRNVSTRQTPFLLRRLPLSRLRRQSGLPDTAGRHSPRHTLAERLAPRRRRAKLGTSALAEKGATRPSLDRLLGLTFARRKVRHVLPRRPP